MRTASMVMGIVGGAIALLFAILIIFGGIAIMNFSSWDSSYNYGFDSDKWESMVDDYAFDDELDDFDSEEFYVETQNMGQTIAGTIFLVFGICTAVASVIGLVGGFLVKKKNVAAGVLMIIAAVLSLFNIISMVLFILGGVFALIRDRQAIPPYPMPPYYPPYPPQQYPQTYTQQSAPPENPPEQPQP